MPESAEHDSGQVGRVDLQYRDVDFRVGSDDVGLEFALVGQGDADIGRAIDYVVIGKNISIRADDHARTQAVLALLARRHVAAAAAIAHVSKGVAAKELAQHVAGIVGLIVIPLLHALVLKVAGRGLNDLGG